MDEFIFEAAILVIPWRTRKNECISGNTECTEFTESMKLTMCAHMAAKAPSQHWSHCSPPENRRRATTNVYTLKVSVQRGGVDGPELKAGNSNILTNSAIFLAKRAGDCRENRLAVDGGAGSKGGSGSWKMELRLRDSLNDAGGALTPQVKPGSVFWNSRSLSTSGKDTHQQ